MTSRFYEYPDLKEVNGRQIPESWKMSKVKFIGEYINGFAFKPAHWADQGVPILRIQNLSDRSSEINRTSFVPPERYRVVKGDILISWSATLDVFQWDGEDAWLNQHIFRVEVNESNTSRHYFYWAAKWFMGELNEASHGSTMQHLTTDKFGGFNVPLPTLNEQQKIANFLDHETTKIDTLIEKQQQLIKLLKEKRQAVISHAVTKGLNPNAPMRDSGVEWLGEVPQHWIVAGFKKYLNKIVDYRGKTPEKRESGVFLVTARNIKNGQINYDVSREYVAYEEYDTIMSRGLPQVGEVLFTTEAPLGEVAQVDREDIALAQRIIKLDGCSGIVDNTFLKFFIMSEHFQQSLLTFASGSTALGIKAERLVYLRMLLPPFQEQKEICSHIELMCKKIDVLISKAESGISLLQERRTALISAAVTGKIDVRDWQPPATESANQTSESLQEAAS